MEIENLEIIIDSDTEKAAKGLQKLKRVLKDLDKNAEMSGLKKLHERLRSIASVNLTKQANALERMVKASKQLNAEKVRKLSDAAKNTPKAEADPVHDKLSGYVEKAKQITSSLGISESMNREWDKLGNKVERIAENAKKGKNAFASMGKAIKTILLYNILFSALNAITKGIKEGLENITRASKEANEVMTQYKSTTLEMKNALGAAAIPTLKLLYPLLRLIADGVIGVANAVNILTSALNGSKTYTRATKYLDDYVKALQKAKGLLGMDEINTVGRTYDYGKMFETANMDTESIAKAAGTLFLLVEGLILFNAVKKGIVSFFTKGGASIASWGAGFGWVAVLVALAVAELVVFALWGKEIIGWLDSFEVKTGSVFTNARGKVEDFFDGLIPAENPFSAYMDNLTGIVNGFVDGLESGCTLGIGVVRNFVGMVYSIFHGDFKGWWEYFKGYFANIGKGIVDSFTIPLNICINCFEAFLNFFVKGLNWIISGINKISFTVPDWVPGIGGKSVGFNIASIPEVSLGRLPALTAGSDTDQMVAGISGALGGAGAVKGSETAATGLYGAIGGAVNSATAEQNSLLREQNELLAQIAAKSPVVPVSSITRGIDRQNRRVGRAVVATSI